MSEIYRMERDGRIAKLPEGAQCDYLTNRWVDDCRGAVCEACKLSQAKAARTE
jgi:hypothetical protein